MKPGFRLARLMSLGLLVFSVAGCNSSSDPDLKAQSQSTSLANNAPTVAVTHPTREDLSRSVSLTAEFEPYQEVEIHAKVSGYVQQINVDVGDHVKTGDVLAVLEIPELEEDLRKADAAVLTAGQEVKSAEAAFEETDEINTRLQAAAKEAIGLIAQQDLDTSAARNRANAANLQAAQQKVIEAQANADRERTLLAYSKITAPFDGVVTKRYADTGALIQAGTTSDTQSMPLVTLAEIKRLRLEFPVPESAVSDVHVGDPVEVNIVSSGQSFPARISRFAQKVDTSTRTMLTEADVDNADFRFTPGMYATVRLTLADKKDALAIPIQTVSAGENPTVLVLDKDHKVEERAVTVGLETSSMAEILSGLSDKDLVVMGSRSSIQLGETALAKEMDGSKL
ncbi:MAG: efflux RND transporter periplasmic adaptor subunit [Methylacidiphilales bacterium]|nr:efflux RND transporter periplasmic adaptor subunit [Candidatus Methylacidiphilales bacterium]